MAKPAAPGLRIRRFAAGEWTEAPDAVVTEEPLQLLLDGEPLAVVMRTPGADVELALGLLFAEGIIRSVRDVRGMRISAEADETESRITVDPALVESNQVDVQLTGKARRKPERSMLASSACGVCGTARPWCRPGRRSIRRCYPGWSTSCAPARACSTARVAYMPPACSMPAA